MGKGGGQEVLGSQGVFPSVFNAIIAGSSNENTTPADGDPTTPLVVDPDPVFSIGGKNVRRVTGRRTPSVINAVFNHRNFWDGRARNHFNGVSPIGELDTNAKVAQVGTDVAPVNADAVGLAPIPLTDLNNASLASQAVGPPGNGVEMSADGRTLRDIGKKLLNLQPLGGQVVATTDSKLGGLVDLDDGKGLNQSYRTMVELAFNAKWWDAPNTKLDAAGTRINALTAPGADLPGGEYSLMQYNWPLFWGLAINLYESTLVSDQTPFDRWASDADPTALNAQEIAGLNVFISPQTSCSGCHSGAEMTQASVSNVAAIGLTDRAGNNPRKFFDTGFINVGVRPIAEDLGNGANRGAGFWSDNKRSVLLGGLELCAVPTDCIVDGSAKITSLRNVALQAPYFHNGSELTLDDVISFYMRGGNDANANNQLGGFNLSLEQRVNLAAFLRALTDPRVENQSAPFDHPQIFVPNGQTNPLAGDPTSDAKVEIPATGAAGGAPLPRFLPQPPLTLPPPPVVTPPVVTPPVVTPPVVTPPVVTPASVLAGTAAPPASPPSDVRLVVSNLFVKSRVRKSSLRSKGLVVTLNVPAGATILRLRLVRLVQSTNGTRRLVERVVIAKLDRKVSGPTAIQITVPARLVRNLPIGQYVLRARTGSVVSDFGPISARRFSIVR